MKTRKLNEEEEVDEREDDVDGGVKDEGINTFEENHHPSLGNHEPRSLEVGQEKTSLQP